MKRVRFTASPRGGFPHPLLALIAEPPGGTETRLLGWNLANRPRVSALMTADGDPEAFRRALSDMTDVEAFELHRTDGTRFYLFLSLHPRDSSIVNRVFDVLTEAGLIVVMPVRYRDGTLHATFVGPSDTVQAVIEDLPPVIEISVEAVGTLDGSVFSPLASLSARQREALEAALQVGYYNQPRSATHEDIAAAIDCAPSTASEHLQKAEAKLVRAMLSGS
ncbi:MAG: helix-turn-helix domain-containing protein [Halodesulfurarchaeum sp.]